MWNVETILHIWLQDMYKNGVRVGRIVAAAVVLRCGCAECVNYAAIIRG